MLADFDPELEMDALAEQLGELVTRGRAGLLQHLALLTDHDALLALALDPDQSVNYALTRLVLAEMLDLDREPVRNLLVHERHELLADHLGDAECEVAVRDHVLWEQQRPYRQTREDLIDEPRQVLAGLRRDRDHGREGAVGEALQRREQLRLPRQRVDLVEHEERAVELVAENLDQRAVVLADALRLDDEQRDVAVLDGLMDLSSHEPVQRALRAPGVTRRVDEHRLVRAAV